MHRDTRRLLTVLIVGMLLSAAGAVIVRDEPERVVIEDNPMPVVAAPAPTVPVTTTTSTTTTSAPAARPTAKRSAPVDVPPNPYAQEPILEIGTIEIPKIGLRHKLFHGITLRNIDRGPSHWPGTAMPGQNGNTVIAGHRVTHTRPFRNIDQLQPGDEVIFTVNGVRSVYAVTGHEIVTPDRVDIVNQTPTPTGTLFACHPPGSARYRYVVRLALLRDR